MWTQGEIVQRIQWHKNLISLKIKANVAPFIAGQFVKLSVEKEGKRISRAYSLVNSPDEELLEILITLIPEGQLSPYLFSLNKGDVIDVSIKAEGYLTLDEFSHSFNKEVNTKEVNNKPKKELWMLATGTGVGPFISMLKTDVPWQRYAYVYLVYSVRYEADLAYLNFLLELERSNYFKLILCVTREKIPCALESRIPNAIETGELFMIANSEISAIKSHVMLCGNPQMIDETKAILEQRGLNKHLRRKAGELITENYWLRS